MTGSDEPTPVGAVMSSCRQSSLAVLVPDPGHPGGWVTAARVVVHDCGCGGCQRSWPTGGAAYGMPSHWLKLVLATIPVAEVPAGYEMPQTGPLVVTTVVPELQAEAWAALATGLATVFPVARLEPASTAMPAVAASTVATAASRRDGIRDQSLKCTPSSY